MKKSRVVTDVGLNINRNDIYKKEIDLLISHHMDQKNILFMRRRVELSA